MPKAQAELFLAPIEVASRPEASGSGYNGKRENGWQECSNLSLLKSIKIVFLGKTKNHAQF